MAFTSIISSLTITCLRNHPVATACVALETTLIEFFPGGKWIEALMQLKNRALGASRMQYYGTKRNKIFDQGGFAATIGTNNANQFWASGVRCNHNPFRLFAFFGQFLR